MKKAYISGRISGIPDFAEKFELAEAQLRAEFPHWDFVNPVKENRLLPVPCDLCPPENTFGFPHTWQHYMKNALRVMLECDVVVMIAGWTNSAGAIHEKEIAEMVGMPVFFFWLVMDGSSPLPD